MYIGKLKAILLQRSSGLRGLVVAAFFAAGGILTIYVSDAATYAVNKEAETGTIAGQAASAADTSASAGQAVRFGLPVSPPNPATRLFTGDYETGNFNQYENCQNVYLNSSCSGIDNSRYSQRVVTSPVRQGTYAARYEVRDGDIPNFGGGERAEVSDDAGGGSEGQERWYQWSTQFTANFPVTGWGGVVAQWHDSSNNPPPLSFDTVDSQTWGMFRNGGTILWTAPMSPGAWQDIKVRIIWSSNPSVGLVELWRNGVRQTFTGGGCTGQTCRISTIGAGGIYFKQGYYRDATHTATGVIYHDGFSAASSEAGLVPL